MRRDFPLENGIFCKGQINDFRLYYNDIALTPQCYMISYVPKTLIAVKSKNTVYMYSPKISTVDNRIGLIKLAIFETFDSNAYMKLKINGKVYIIDSNVQVSICECNKIY